MAIARLSVLLSLALALLLLLAHAASAQVEFVTDAETIQSAADVMRGLPEDDRATIQTWLIFEGLARIVYYIAVFLAVFLLGRRIIQGIIAGYREARAQSV